MKTLLTAAALAIAGAVTVQAADIAPVTGHWTKLGGDFSALVYYIDEPDGFHVVVTTQQGAREKAAVARFGNGIGGGAVGRGFHSARRQRGAGADRPQQC
jgi:opacity protein-like surface antigen